jgi:hypothetical protein
MSGRLQPQRISRMGKLRIGMKHYTAEWLLVLALITLLITAFLVAQQRDDLKAEAVKRGAAEWVADYNGITTFKWKEKQ